jgi:hypothetical protein
MTKRAVKVPLVFRNVPPSVGWPPKLFEQITDLLAEALVQDVRTSPSTSIRTLTRHEVTRILIPSRQGER